MHTQKGLIHILVVLILLAGLGATLYLSQKTQIFKPKAFETQSDQITNLTADLLEAKDDREPNPDEMVRLAQERKDKLLLEAKNNTQAFLDHATLADQTTTFPEEIQPYLEKKVEIQGTVTALHGHSDQNDRGSFIFQLKTQGRNYNLNFVVPPHNLLQDSEVSVRGVALGNELVLGGQTTTTADTNIQTISTSTLDATGTRKMAVLLVNTQPNETPVITQDYIRRQLVAEDTESANTFFRENSFGQFRGYQPDFFGWYDIPITNTPNRTCDGDGRNYIATATDATAQAAGVNLNQYQNIAYIINTREGTNCGIWGTLGGNPGRIWIGTNNDSYSILGHHERRSTAFIHELGHTLGLHHAGAVLCGRFPNEVPIDRYENCQVIDSADDTVMSSNQPYLHFNAPHKIALGWIPSSQVQTVTSSGTYTISPPNELPGVGSRVLKIRKADTNEYYFVAYPQPYSLDNYFFNFNPSDILTTLRRPGTTIYIWNEDPTIPTKRIVARPPTSLTSGSSPRLDDGGEFVDPINGIRIRQLSHLFSSVTLEVNFTTPLVTPSPTSTPIATVPCTITSASWRASSPVTAETPVGVFAQATGNCVGKLAHFTIYEAGYRTGPFPPNQPSDVAFIGEEERWTVSTDWTTTFVSTRTNGYYFRVDIVNQQNSTFFVPDLLEVVR